MAEERKNLYISKKIWEMLKKEAWKRSKNGTCTVSIKKIAEEALKKYFEGLNN